MIILIIKISHKCVCGRIGQGSAGMRPKCLTGLHQRTWAPAALSQREGRKGSQDGLITDLIYCFWPPVYKAPSGLSVVYPGDCFYLSCCFSRFKLCKCWCYHAPCEQRSDDICMARMGLAAASSALCPGDTVMCHESHRFPPFFVAQETQDQAFVKRGAVGFYYCYLFCIYYQTSLS